MHSKRGFEVGCRALGPSNRFRLPASPGNTLGVGSQLSKYWNVYILEIQIDPISKYWNNIPSFNRSLNMVDMNDGAIQERPYSVLHSSLDSAVATGRAFRFV